MTGEAEKNIGEVRKFYWSCLHGFFCFRGAPNSFISRVCIILTEEYRFLFLLQNRHCFTPHCHCFRSNCHCFTPKPHCFTPLCQCFKPNCQCFTPKPHCFTPLCQCFQLNRQCCKPICQCSTIELPMFQAESTMLYAS